MKTGKERISLFLVVAVLLMFGFIGISEAAVDKVHIRATCNVPANDLMAGTMDHFLQVLKA